MSMINIEEAINIVCSRKSVRTYSNIPLSTSEMNTILKVAKSGPVSGGLDCLNVDILTTDSEKQCFYKACYYQEFVKNAAAIFVISSKDGIISNAYNQEYVQRFECENATIAAHNIIIASTFMGLSTCFIGAIRQDMITKVTKPDSSTAWCAVCVGKEK